MRGLRRLILFLSILILLCCGIVNTPATTQPKTNTWTQPMVIYIDERFSKEQQTDIWNAMGAWEAASNGTVSFIPYFNVKPPARLKDLYGELNNKSVFVWYVDKTKEDLGNTLFKDINDRETKEGVSLDGLWDGHGNILLFKNMSNRFYKVSLHELGHALGLGHTDKNYNTVMHPNAVMDCITEIDVNELCKLYYCLPRAECCSSFSE